MKKCFIAFLFFTHPLIAQEKPPLTLESAYELARINYPSIKQKDLIRKTAELNISNLNKEWIPQLNINGQATYQSDITTIDLPTGTSIAPVPKDRYNIIADLNQKVYDGGIVKQQKKLEKVNAEVEDIGIEVELYEIRDRINQLYLGTLLMDEQLSLLELLRNDLRLGITQMEAKVQNGVALKSDLNVLKAELLDTDQRKLELLANRKALLLGLSLFMNQMLEDDQELQKPVLTPVIDSTQSRPELSYFDKQKIAFDQQYQVTKAFTLPVFELFLQGGYGRPGLDLFKDQFDLYYYSGARLNWNFGGLYRQKNDKELTQMRQRTVDARKETFLLNIKVQEEKQLEQIKKFKSFLESDREILALRNQIKEAAKAQLENGVITSNDYLLEVDKEDQARQSLATHELQLLDAQIKYKYFIGQKL